MITGKSKLISSWIISFLLGVACTISYKHVQSKLLTPIGTFSSVKNYGGIEYRVLEVSNNLHTHEYWIFEKANRHVVYSNIKVDCQDLRSDLVEQRIFSERGLFIESTNVVKDHLDYIIPVNLALAEACIN